ncbi:MAG: phosphopentomutase [Lachnospiraceae bacterium]
MNRVIWIVLDSVGMGAMPDADRFHDEDANTILHVAERCKDFRIPNMVSLGYGNIDGMQGIPKCDLPLGCFARLEEISNGKDTTTGHWEMVGIRTEQAFPVYPEGFPKEVIDAFCRECGIEGVLGNKPASGTEIIKELGEEHEKTGWPIVYTSADSVFQIAAHEEVIPPSKLYEMCRIARKILDGEHRVARVIARPFVGSKGVYERTANRRDFSIEPDRDNLLVRMKEAGHNVVGIGKIEDIFCGCGITEAIHTKNNMDGVDVTLQCMDRFSSGLIFTNLVEFDSKWGHRNDYEGYAKGLMEWDERLPEILEKMTNEDLLVITADHGCDPTTPGTDHTREYVPLLIYGKNIKSNVNLGTIQSFASIGQTLADIFKIEPLSIGKDLLELIR